MGERLADGGAINETRREGGERCGEEGRGVGSSESYGEEEGQPDRDEPRGDRHRREQNGKGFGVGVSCERAEREVIEGRVEAFASLGSELVRVSRREASRRGHLADVSEMPPRVIAGHGVGMVAGDPRNPGDDEDHEEEDRHASSRKRGFLTSLHIRRRDHADRIPGARRSQPTRSRSCRIWPAMARSKDGSAPGTAVDAVSILGTLFVTGAAVMALEILGARVIGPHFGASLYVWTALISVTLLALAVGYWLGGTIADRGASRKGLGWIVAAAGGVVLLVPLIRSTVIGASISLGVRGGALVAATILFFPPLAILGGATPYGTKLYTRSVDVVGRSVGRLYAVSTVGSFVGAIGTGFFLVPSLSVTRCLLVTSGFLIATALVLLLRDRLHGAVAGAAVLIVAAVVPSAREAGHLPGLVYHKSSAYGDLRVLDYGGERLLFMDGVQMTGVERETGFSSALYDRVMTARLRLCRPQAKSALLIGLGGGTLVLDLASIGVRTDSIEVDPDVVDVATRYFDFDPRANAVWIGDARTLLGTLSSRYDVAIIDAFLGERVPGHLVSLEALEAIRDRVLAPEGVVAINFLGMVEGRPTSGVQALHRTLREVFGNVRVFHASPPGSKLESLVLLASTGRLEPILSSATFNRVPRGEPHLVRWEGECAIDEGDAPLLKDDWNTIDTVDEATRLCWREDILAGMPPDVRERFLAE
jgi:spermidine synthase